MNTKALRQKILDLAIHGKLVPQAPSDEPASALLSRINPKAEIYCDNRLYGNLPKGWCWVSGKYLYNPMKSTKPKGPTFKYIDIDSIDNTKQKIDRPKTIRTENAPSRATRYTQKGDIVFSMVRPYLKNIAIVPSDECIASTGFYICSPSDIAISKYCYYLMTSDYVVNGLNQFMKGDNSPSINKRDIENWQFPLPPLKEQERIVAEIERWFSLIDFIDRSKDTLADTIQQAKSKILDLAIHGKLVPQDPNDEPASALLKRLNPNAQTTSDTPPYHKLPRGWRVTHGKYLFKPMKSTKPKGLNFKYIDIDSIDNTKQQIGRLKTARTENAPSRASRYTKKGDIVFSMVRPYLKNIAIVPSDECIASTGFYVCSPSDIAISKYCYYLMISDYVVNGLNQFMKGDNSPSINKGDIDNWLFPLPPIAEQHRIVSKIEELFAQLDKIEASL